MDQLKEKEMLSQTAAEAKKSRKTADVLGVPEENIKKPKRAAKNSASYNTIAIWAVQCIECHKWRVIPTQDEYEEIRGKAVEEPFTCKRKEGSCDDPGDVEFGCRRLWVMDKPNIPKSPAGFKRQVTVRKNMERLDCFYETPFGRKLRSPSEVAAFLLDHLEFKELSLEDFNFRAPKVARSTIHLAGCW